jgi:serine/threonine protein kinase
MGGAADDSRAGTHFGFYHLRRLIGRGRMSEVYEAEDTRTERVVALKLLSPELSQDQEFHTRLRREAHAQVRVYDPHVVPNYDYGVIDGVVFVDMPLIKGSDLRTMLAVPGR